MGEITLLPRYQIERFETRYGAMYALTADTVIGRSLRIYGEWAEHEIATLSALLSPAEAIIDIGANIGTHTLAFSRRFPQSKVFAIEAQPLPCAMLMATVAVNNLSNVHVLNLGASNIPQVLEVQFDYEALEGNAGAFGIHRFQVARGHGYPLLLVPLDHLGIRERIQLIKIDVEGMEAAVLRGANAVLERHRPIVFFELLTLEALEQPRVQLQDLDYELYWLETWPFNKNNFRGAHENVWSICEMGIIALPRENKVSINLPHVTGREVGIPHRLDPREGYDRESIFS